MREFFNLQFWNFDSLSPLQCCNHIERSRSVLQHWQIRRFFKLRKDANRKCLFCSNVSTLLSMTVAPHVSQWLPIMLRFNVRVLKTSSVKRLSYLHSADNLHLINTILLLRVLSGFLFFDNSIFIVLLTILFPTVQCVSSVPTIPISGDITSLTSYYRQVKPDYQDPASQAFYIKRTDLRNTNSPLNNACDSGNLTVMSNTPAL